MEYKDVENGLVRIEKCSINGFSMDVVKACELYMCLDESMEFNHWLERMIALRKVGKDFFQVYSGRGPIFLFSINAAKQIAMTNDSEGAARCIEHLSAYEQKMKKNTYETVLLSDNDRNSVLQDFAKAIGAEKESVVLPTETLASMVDTIRLCKLQIDQIQKRLEQFDFSGVEHID